MHLSAAPSPLHACMTHAYVRNSIAHCVLFNIRNIFGTTCPAPEHGYGTVRVFSESVHDLGVRERHLAMHVTIQTESFCDNLN